MSSILLPTTEALISLQSHCKANTVDKIALSEDGSTLTFSDGNTAAAREMVACPSSSSSSDAEPVWKTEYSLLTLYLFLKDDSVVEHRNACKKYDVEPVKVLDRSAVQKYFAVDANIAKGDADSSSKHVKSGAVTHSSKKDRRQSSEKKHEANHLTQEKMLANLTMVADKRADAVILGSSQGNHTTAGGSQENSKESEIKDIIEDDAILSTKLNFLSADGFDVIDDSKVLEEDRAKVNEITKLEIAVGDASSVLRAWDARSLSRVLDLFKENARGGTSTGTSSSKKRDSHAVVSSKDPQGSKRPKKKANGLPVIVVPNAVTSPITMLNAKEFFHDAKYIPIDIMKKNGARKMPVVKFRRILQPKYGGKEVEYEIIDNPHVRFGKNRDEWDRIVAVVAQGADWQFKGWRWLNPVQIFTNSFGFFVSMEGEPIPTNLTKWNVVQSKLNRDKRGLDSVTYASFWNNLDEWMLVNKPEYLPQEA